VNGRSITSKHSAPRRSEAARARWRADADLAALDEVALELDAHVFKTGSDDSADGRLRFRGGRI
jgi:hypothetical protein